jgi:hypothetical protein
VKLEAGIRNEERGVSNVAGHTVKGMRGFRGFSRQCQGLPARSAYHLQATPRCVNHQRCKFSLQIPLVLPHKITFQNRACRVYLLHTCCGLTVSSCQSCSSPFRRSLQQLLLQPHSKHTLHEADTCELNVLLPTPPLWFFHVVRVTFCWR